MTQTTDIHAQYILIVDFGSQYTQLIARRVRQCGVFCQIWPYDHCEHILDDSKLMGIILSGGPESVAVEKAPRAPQRVFELGLPVLGICYGMQVMALQLGGNVVSASVHEYGYAQVQVLQQLNLLTGIEDKRTATGESLLEVWMSHGDRVESMPPSFVAICTSLNAPIAGMASETRQLYGLQFHPEVTHTLQGLQIIKRFLFDICNCQNLWQPANIIQDSLDRVQKLVANGRVLLGLSGGVDSSVVAALLHKAIGERLICVFVDNGLLRLHEGDRVMETFAQHLGIKVIRVNAGDRFLKGLRGVTDPEQKRKIIGNLFIEIFEDEASHLNDVQWLAQGTIYPDVIESAGNKTGKAHAIKSHHNVGGLPSTMQLQLVEPLRELFKDEVRHIGIALGLPHAMVYRHPFPGPGLAVRILGEVKKEYIELLRQADAIFIDELHQSDLYDSVSQAFAVFLPVKAVGVVGDTRRYEYVICLRAVKTIDFMTAQFAPLPLDFLERVARRIIQEIRGIARVTYDISSKPPATIEWE
ncbi:GMP synthase [Achromatium sp. WMS1]|nr:GMP synthase [Achromatium sp. WMS1]